MQSISPTFLHSHANTHPHTHTQIQQVVWGRTKAWHSAAINQHTDRQAKVTGKEEWAGGRESERETWRKGTRQRRLWLIVSVCVCDIQTDRSEMQNARGMQRGTDTSTETKKLHFAQCVYEIYATHSVCLPRGTRTWASFLVEEKIIDCDLPQETDN